MKTWIALFLCTIALHACKKEDTAAPLSNTTGNPSTFSPPTSNYWKINGTANNPSMDAVNVNLAGTSMSVSKPFTDLNYGYCQLRVFSNNTSLNLMNEVPEGGFKDYFITTNSTTSSDSLRVEVDVEDNNTNTSGYYFYRAVGGKIHVSKLNGKLRYTSDGNLSMTGVKYPDMQSYIYAVTVDFSQAQP